MGLFLVLDCFVGSVRLLLWLLDYFFNMVVACGFGFEG